MNCKLKQKSLTKYNMIINLVKYYLESDNSALIAEWLIYARLNNFSDTRISHNIVRAAYEYSYKSYWHDYIVESIYPMGLNDSHLATACIQACKINNII